MNLPRISAEELIASEMSKIQPAAAAANPTPRIWSIPMIIGIVFIAAVGLALYIERKSSKFKIINNTQNEPNKIKKPEQVG